MSGLAQRRGFLRGLATLPLIGGGVALIGNPTGAAEPPSRECAEGYLAWLHYEKRAVQSALYPEMFGGDYVPLDNGGAHFHFADRFGSDGWYDRVQQEAVARAPVILAAVGCDWRDGGRCA